MSEWRRYPGMSDCSKKMRQAVDTYLETISMGWRRHISDTISVTDRSQGVFVVTHESPIHNSASVEIICENVGTNRQEWVANATFSPRVDLCVVSEKVASSDDQGLVHQVMNILVFAVLSNTAGALFLEKMRQEWPAVDSESVHPLTGISWDCFLPLFPVMCLIGIVCVFLCVGSFDWGPSPVGLKVYCNCKRRDFPRPCPSFHVVDTR